MSGIYFVKNSIFLLVLLANFFYFFGGTSAQNNESVNDASTVSEVLSTLDLAKFPTPEDAEHVSAVRSGLFFTTSEDLDHVSAMVSNEMLKRGFAEGETYRTKSASVTVLSDGRPGTIMLTNSFDGNLTHVTFHHHQGVDVSKVPMLDHVGEVFRRVDEITYSTKIGVLEGQHLLREKIDALGIELARMSISNGIAQTYFKNGIKFVSHVEENENFEFEMARESSPKQTRAYITSSGSTDVTKLPMPGRTKESIQPYNSVFGIYRYDVADGPQNAVKLCGKALQEAGWTPAKATRESVSDYQGLFIRRGTLLQVGAKQYDDGPTQIQYVLSMLPFDIPADIETRLISVDTATPHMFFVTPAPVESVAKFYKAHIPSLGWQPEGEKYEQSNTDEYRNLFKGSYYQPLMLKIAQKDPTSTWVELRPIDFGEVSSVFFAKKGEQPEVTQPAENVAEAQPESSPMVPETSGADVQIELEKGLEDMMRKQLEAALQDLGPEEAAEARKMFESTLKDALGGVNEATESDAGEDLQNESFNETGMIEDSTSEEPAKAVVPTDKIAAEEFPVPEDAQNVSRDFGMVTFSTNKVKESAQWLDKTLTDLGWKRRGEQMIESDMAILKFQKGAGTINASFILDDRRNPPVHVVIQGDGIHFADDEFGGAEMEAEGLIAEEMEGSDAFQDDQGAFGGQGFDDEMKEFEGLSLPDGTEGSVKSSTEFRKELTTSIESDVATMFNYFQKSGPESGWKPTTHVQNKDQNATINFVNERGELQVKLERYDSEVEIHLVFRDPKAAEKHGFLPETGKGRLILANASESPVTIRINTKTYELDAGQGAENPKDGIILNVLPGGYNYTITAANREEQSDKLKVEVGGTWGLIVFPQQGHMAERMY